MGNQKIIKKHYLNYPEASSKINIIQKIYFHVKGLFLSPLYWGLSYFASTPGLFFRRYCIELGMYLIFKFHDFRKAFFIIVFPMDSVRYFEFDFIWRKIKKVQVNSYLDVSSPRLFPLMMLWRNKNLVGNFINPDKKDLQVTKTWAKSLKLSDKCSFYDTLIQYTELKKNSFDVITSISVIEHIPDDKIAIQKMWDMLKPGGRLFITVPCAAEASEEYININEYELLSPDKDGFVFWQRYYDEKLLEQRFFCITGKPNSYKVYGEKIPGSYQKNVTQKRTDCSYPYWKEPLMMGLEYTYKNTISELPGMGVIAMEFIKK